MEILIEPQPNGVLHVRELRPSGFYRYCVLPGEDVSQRPQEVQESAYIHHTPEVIEAYQAMMAGQDEDVDSTPSTNWDALNLAIMGDAAFNQTYAAVMASHPLIAAALPAALTQVATGQTAMFEVAFVQMCAVAEVSPAQRETWAQIAEACYAPPSFVSIVRGAPNA